MRLILGFLLLCGSIACSTSPSPRPVSTAQSIDLPGYAKNRVFRDQAIIFAGQPSEDALRAAATAGQRVVLNLRTTAEVEALSFDERELVEELGMRYVSIPVAPTTFSVADVDRFAEIVGSDSSPILIHCASSNRVGGVWAAYLVLHRGMDEEEAIRRGKAAGLVSPGMVDATRRVIGDQPGGE